MKIMNMTVLMLKGFVMMLVVMPFREMQPDPDGHQRAGDDELDRQGFGQNNSRQHRAEEGRQRIIGPGPRRAEMAKSQDEGNQAHADDKETDHGGGRRDEQSRQRRAG